MNVTAIVVTRGDVDLAPVFETIPKDWECLIWDNGRKLCRGLRMRTEDYASLEVPVEDMAVYGRYAAIRYATSSLIYVQDDDAVISRPEEIVTTLIQRYETEEMHCRIRPPVVCNMPPEFRHNFYHEHALVGFGAAFHRDAPWVAFSKLPEILAGEQAVFFQRTCDIAFTALTPRILVDVPKTNLDHAYASNRMWLQPGHVEERTRMLELVRGVA